jgi:hypothetical protein
MACAGCQQRRVIGGYMASAMMRGDLPTARAHLRDMMQSAKDDVRNFAIKRGPGLRMQPPPGVPPGEQPKLRLRADLSEQGYAQRPTIQK